MCGFGDILALYPLWMHINSDNPARPSVMGHSPSGVTVAHMFSRHKVGVQFPTWTLFHFWLALDPVGAILLIVQQLYKSNKYFDMQNSNIVYCKNSHRNCKFDTVLNT